MKKIDLISSLLIFVAIIIAIVGFSLTFKYARKADEEIKILKIRSEQLFAEEELLHSIWQRDSIAWKNEVIPTPEYQKLDSLREGDWEDFYFEW